MLRVLCKMKIHLEKPPNCLPALEPSCSGVAETHNIHRHALKASCATGPAHLVW
ncbi:hypothetical protein I79_005537 [Cricetulus griseus]|uniref:Uncharacterized protein n=1 Tax=Cricetulus griseus TaxID=10029 RepID=G3H5F6_CRIGR|nr:hypothetical protein I79_005537 [Cricetulus griseus]